jgi:hypothetical protein
MSSPSPLSLPSLLVEIDLTGAYVSRRIEARDYVSALAQLTTTEAHLAEVRRRLHEMAAADEVAS